MKPSEEEDNAESSVAPANIRDIFWSLSNNSETQRITALESLLSTLSLQQQKIKSETLSLELEYTFNRLVQGLGSGRKSTRLGFSTALTCLLTNTPSTLFNSTKLLKLLSRKLAIPDGLKSEKREVLMGQTFCLVSLIRSKKLVEDNIEENLTTTVNALLRLSKTKSYLKKMCFHGLCELVMQVDSNSFGEAVWPSLYPLFESGWENCSVESLQLLIICNKYQPSICGKYFLQSFDWIPRKSTTVNLISKRNFKDIARIIAETTACHPKIDDFPLKVISTIGEQGAEELGSFWEEHLSKALFNSSPERKYLGLKLAVHSLSYISPAQVSQVWSENLISDLFYFLQHKDHVMHLVCKKELPADLAIKLGEEGVSSELQYALLFKFFYSPWGIHFDIKTQSNIVSTIVNHLKLPALLKYIEWLKQFFLRGTDIDTELGEVSLFVLRKWCGNQLAQLTRTSTLPRNEKWIVSIFRFLFFHSRFTVLPNNKESNIEEALMTDKLFIELEDTSRSIVVQNVTSLVTTMSNMPCIPKDDLEKDFKQASHVPGITSSGDFWLSHVVRYADSLLSSEHIKLAFNFDDSLRTAWSDMIKNMSKVSKTKSSKRDKIAEGKAMLLLLIHVALQMLSVDPQVQKSSVGILRDLEVIVKKRFIEKRRRKSEPSDEPHWVEVIVEIILNMMSVDSNSVRVTAEQVFRLVCPHLTEGALKLITDILKIKSNEELMKQNNDDSGMEDEGDEDLTDDENNEAMESDESESEEEGKEEVEGVDEDFRKKVKDALGDAAAQVEEEEDMEEEKESDEDLSDDAMMRLDGTLAEIFKQRKKYRPNQKDTKRQFIHFQVRCLDLLEVFINRHHDDNPLILDVVPALLSVIERGMKDPEKEVLVEKASVILRVKLCKIKNFPRDLDDSAIERCHCYVEDMLKMCLKNSRGVFHSQIVSHACLFYLRVLSGCHSSKSHGAADGDRICKAFEAVLEDFMTCRQSKIQSCVFTEFVRRQPVLAQGLIEPLIKFMKEGVQAFRKMQACEMLRTLFSSPESREITLTFSNRLIEEIHVVLTSSGEKPNEINSKYFAEAVKLLPPAVAAIKKQKEDYDWSSLTEILQKLLETEEFKRSQMICNNIWNVLTVIGLKRVKTKKVKKAKRVVVEKQSANKDNDGAVEVKAKESRRERKSRVMKEKKLARRKSQKKRTHPESEDQPAPTEKRKKSKRRKTNSSETKSSA